MYHFNVREGPNGSLIPLGDQGQVLHLMPFTKMLRCLDFVRPIEYSPAVHRMSNALHFGQLKLLLSEIEFLTRYGHLARKVVYVGASPGLHIGVLLKMFPDHKFYLYDPVKVYRGLANQRDRVVINTRPYDARDMKFWSKLHHLLISDMRSFNDGMSFREKEECVDYDNAFQLQIHLIARPLMASYKFRTSHLHSVTRIPDGEFTLPVWSRRGSAESRLFAGRDDGVITLENMPYEHRMFHFQTRIRRYAYQHNEESVQCNCYDCVASLHILDEYAHKYKCPDSGDMLHWLVEAMPGRRSFAYLVCRHCVEVRARKRETTLCDLPMSAYRMMMSVTSSLGCVNLYLFGISIRINCDKV
jgi:hypothetical protein